MAGAVEDEETGLYYNRFRYYDPDAGEYVSQDPIRLAGGLSSHAYIRDPLTWEDPHGLESCYAEIHHYPGESRAIRMGSYSAKVTNGEDTALSIRTR